MSEETSIDQRSQQAAEILEAASPWIERNFGCKVQPGPFGLSLVATRTFWQGDVILEEHPVALGLPWAPASAPESLHTLNLQPEMSQETWAAALHFAFPSQENRPKGPADMKLLTGELAMYAPCDSMAASTYKDMLRGLAAQGLLTLEQETDILQALLMKKFTSLPLAGSWAGGRCLFAVTSKINHSCFPNCAVLYQGLPFGENLQDPVAESFQHDQSTRPRCHSCAQVRAVTKIECGEELTWSYLGNGFAAASTTETRRAKLRAGFEFECCCPVCEPGDADPPTHGQICRRALAYGKPPPLPPQGLRGPLLRRPPDKAIDVGEGACEKA